MNIDTIAREAASEVRALSASQPLPLNPRQSRPARAWRAAVVAMAYAGIALVLANRDETPTSVQVVPPGAMPTVPSAPLTTAVGSAIEEQYMGLEFQANGVPLPDGFVDNGGGILGEAVAGPTYAVHELQSGRTHVLLVSRGLGPANPPLWKVVDVLEIETPEDSWAFPRDCSVDGARDPWIIAFVFSPDAFTEMADVAWRFDPDPEQAVPIDPMTVTCELGGE